MSQVHRPNAGNDENTSIVASCPQGFVGVASIFRHGEKEGLWKFIPIQKILKDPPDILILGAWYPGYELLIDCLPKTTKIVIWITSAVAQIEMTPIELDYINIMSSLLEYKKIAAIFYSGTGVDDFFIDKKRIFHAFYPLSTIKMFNSQKMYSIKKPRSAALFLPAHFRKNIYNQTFALKSLVREHFTTHSNVNIGLPNQTNFRFHNWLKESDYLALLSESMVSMHCTWTESFSYGAAESIINGTIPIISPTIAKNLELSHNKEEITVNNLDNFNEIADRVRSISCLAENSYLELLTILQNDLKKYSIKAKYLLEETLESVKNV